MTDLINTFDRVVVVNLARRPERMEQFRSTLGDWPFKQPERFEAIDGFVVGVPRAGTRVPGLGLHAIPREIMSRALNDGARSILVLEDDACPAENFAAWRRTFCKTCRTTGRTDARRRAPGQTDFHSPGVVRCHISNRTHALPCAEG